VRLFAVAGEPSGDVRAAELLGELAKIGQLDVAGMGGPRMAAAGAVLSERMEAHSVMGFAEVLRSAAAFAALERRLHEACLDFSPDAMLLVDYPGFNLRFAKWASRKGLKVIYYISPQIWAWGGWRVPAIRESVSLMVTLFEFEHEFYRSRGIRSTWSGHPLVDAIPVTAPGGRSIAVLPGSRAQEVSRLLPVMLDAARRLVADGSADGVVVARSGNLPESLYDRCSSQPGVGLADGTSEALAGARGAFVCSGTATLETSLHGIPFVVLYRTSPVTYGLARLLVRGVDRICLASIAAGIEAAPELIQGRVTAARAAEALRPLLADGPRRDGSLAGLARVRASLGAPGAAARAAAAIAGFLEGSQWT